MIMTIRTVILSVLGVALVIAYTFATTASESPKKSGSVQLLAVCDPPLTDNDGDDICDNDDLDDDNDGIPDSFEAENQLDSLDATDGLGDLDGDGFSNLAEFLAGSDPVAPTSVPSPSVSTTTAASVLPLSRSAQVGNTVTAFATILNVGPEMLVNCTLAPNTPLDATFFFNTTDPATNAVTGAINEGANIAAASETVDGTVNGMASYVFGFTPTAAFDPVDVSIRFSCDNSDAVSVLSGINTISLSASETAVPDIVALAATPTANGVLSIPDIAAPGAFSVASVNLGASGGVTATATANSQGVPLPLTLTLCETDLSGACINPLVPAETVTTMVETEDTSTFSVFVSASEVIDFAPGSNRITVEFRDDIDVVRGSTGVAVEAMEPAPPVGPTFTQVQEVFTGNCAFSGCHAGPNPAANQSLEAGVAFEMIVGVASVQQSNLSRIEPNNPNDSYLIRKLEGGPNISGSQMPLGGSPLPQSTIDLIRDWISAGALNN